MRFYLVQHAEAKPETEDPERHLTERGQEEIRKVAAFLAGRGLAVPRILHSGRTRARETAEILAEALHPSQGLAETDGLGPMDEPGQWVQRLRESQEELMLVGHLPHLSRLASSLLCGDPERQVIAFQMAGVVCLERREDGSWWVRWMVTPDLVA